MKVQLRWQGEDLAILAEAKAAGYEARLVKGAVVVDLPSFREPGDYRVLPETSRGWTPILIATECGGASTSTGYAMVVCGPGGEALCPFRVPKGGHLSCGIHAYFKGPSFVWVSTLWNEGVLEVTLIRVAVEKVEACIRLYHEAFWSGTPEELPEVFAHFAPAIQAACEKTACYHCRHVHYAAV